MQNRRKKWNFLLNFRTMGKLSDHYSRIFQTQSSGCASGVNYFRNFTKLKNLNFYLLNYKIYISNNSQIFQKISEWWVLNNLDIHLEQKEKMKNKKSQLFLWNLMVKYWSDRIKSWIYTDFRAFRTWHQLLSLAVVFRSNRGMWMWVKKEDGLTVVRVSYFLVVHIPTFSNRPNGW